MRNRPESLPEELHSWGWLLRQILNNHKQAYLPWREFEQVPVKVQQQHESDPLPELESTEKACCCACIACIKLLTLSLMLKGSRSQPPVNLRSSMPWAIAGSTDRIITTSYTDFNAFTGSEIVRNSIAEYLLTISASTTAILTGAWCMPY